MPVPIAPLLFPETLNFPGLWKTLGKAHTLADSDFNWLAQVKLATHALRSAQTPPMVAQNIRISAGTQPALTLAGSFILSGTSEDKPAFLYTPYDGLKKYESLETLKTLLKVRLSKAEEEDQLLAFLALAQRRVVSEQSTLTITYETIQGDIFDNQKAAIQACQQLNAEALLAELKQLPALTSLLEKILDEMLKGSLPGLQQGQTRVNFYTQVPGSTQARQWHDSITLTEALLTLYRHRTWPVKQLHEFANPRHAPTSADQALWEDVLEQASEKLRVLLFRQMEQYWDAPAAAGSTRRVLFAEVLQEQARAELMLKREAGIIDASQFAVLHQMIQYDPLPTRRPTIENVRLWEYEANYVELAGSLMISHSDACLYTPTQGLQVLKDYNDLKDTVLSKFRASGHQDEFYGLLNLEEVNALLVLTAPM